VVLVAKADMHMTIRVFFLSLRLVTMGAGSLQAAGQPDPNIDPVLPDPKPNNAWFPPAAATAGSADPGPILNAMPVTAQELTGRGPAARRSVPARWIRRRCSIWCRYPRRRRPPFPPGANA
jgi:hypothetical protein